jgi:hypothetical protein
MLQHAPVVGTRHNPTASPRGNSVETSGRMKASDVDSSLETASHQQSTGMSFFVESSNHGQELSALNPSERLLVETGPGLYPNHREAEQVQPSMLTAVLKKRQSYMISQVSGDSHIPGDATPCLSDYASVPCIGSIVSFRRQCM